MKIERNSKKYLIEKISAAKKEFEAEKVKSL